MERPYRVEVWANDKWHHRDPSGWWILASHGGETGYLPLERALADMEVAKTQLSNKNYIYRLKAKLGQGELV